jgi:shikimate dehydrogenase
VITLRGTTRLAAVLGDPIAHSRSPQLVTAALAALGLDAVMVPMRVPVAALPDVVRALVAIDALGASVTVPHKQAVIACCAGLTERAARAGAVNSLRLAGGKVVGDNTDGAGLLADLAEHGVAVAGRAVVVLGAGGAARAIETALADAGARTIVIARRPDAADWLPASQVRPWQPASLEAALADATLLIDATSAALDEPTDQALAASLPVAALPRDAAVVSLVYHRRSALLRAAAARGLGAIDGRGMLIHQAALSIEAWCGLPAPLDVMRRVMRELAG